MKEYTLVFEPMGLKTNCGTNETVLECAHKAGLIINSVCGGRGTCKTCRFRMNVGKLSPPNNVELQALTRAEIKDGWRLACQATPLADCRCWLPPESLGASQRVLVDGLGVKVTVWPTVVAYDVSLTPPSLADQQADADRLAGALKKQHQTSVRHFDYHLLRKFSQSLSVWQWQCRAWVWQDEVISVNEAHRSGLGLAVDLGTSTVAAYLIDITTGRILASKGEMNPQISYGEDIISRINRALGSPKIAAGLKQLAVTKINEMARQMCRGAGLKTSDIVNAVVVGNTAMHHLFLGLPVKKLSLSPFNPVVGMAVDIKARETGLKLAPGAYVNLLPVVAGFVGSDHVAALLTLKDIDEAAPLVMLDIGTNTEISLLYRGKITTTSCASGPAFEGGHIQHGMRAGSGAIERVKIENNKVLVQTVDNAPALGICGSGTLDALAELYLCGAVDSSGRFVPGHPLVTNVENGGEVILARKGDGDNPVVITQGDIRELQLATASVRTGISALLRINGLAEHEVGKTIIAGSFGSYISIPSALAIGLFPPNPPETFVQVGNAAGVGACMALVSVEKRAEASKIAHKAKYVELASAKGFQKTFLQACSLGNYIIE
ncbi:ASKHA domain-containing protein [Chloroflexota bacterium]